MPHDSAPPPHTSQNRSVAAAGLGAMPSLTPGRIFGGYAIERMLGAGAMGEVYLARQVRLERQCAVKVLPSILSQSPDFERRFSIEGKALAKLDHPNVVRVLNAGEDGGRHFLEMEYVEGGSLEDMLARSGGRLTEGYTRNALTEILTGLAYAHARNIVHRDLKPANILCPPDGHCKISDFGLALVAGEDYMQSVVRKSIAVSQIAGYGTSPTGGSPSALGKTLSREELERLLGPLGLSSGEAAALVGTPYYMSPEVHSGQPVDGRSDIYAVGVMTYRMLTGRIPLGMPKPPSKLVPGLPIEWDTWVAKCMDPEPEDRFQSAEEALEALPGGGRKSIDGLGEARRRMMVRSTGVVVASLILAAIAASIIVGLTAGDEHDINPKLAADSSAARISADPLELIATDYVTVVVIDKTDGTHLFQGTLAAGERRTVQAYGPVEIRYNNGAGLIVERDGRRMVMGTTGTGRTTIVGPVGREANAPPAGQDEEMRQQMAELERQRQELAVQQAQLDEQRLQAEAERARLEEQRRRQAETERALQDEQRQQQAAHLAQTPAQPLVLDSQAQASAAPEEGRSWTVPEVNLQMTWIAPGSFLMGSPDSEVGRGTDEGPQHRVTLTRGYWLGTYEVTQRQFEALMGNNPSDQRDDGGDLPVENVSWDNAMEFCALLTARERRAGRLPTGYAYTLPTEAQWEYACRAGTIGPYYGNGSLGAVGWYINNSGGSGHPHRVGQKLENAWGLYDMHGNVWEWCSDWYGDYSSGTINDPTGPISGMRRVLRGGGVDRDWKGNALRCRSASRDSLEPHYRFFAGRDFHYFNLGFRLALSSVQ